MSFSRVSQCGASMRASGNGFTPNPTLEPNTSSIRSAEKIMLASLGPQLGIGNVVTGGPVLVVGASVDVVSVGPVVVDVGDPVVVDTGGPVVVDNGGPVVVVGPAVEV